jgi:hypothetical protein
MTVSPSSHCAKPMSNTCSPATDEEDWTNDYPISPKYKERFDDIAPKWRATPLPAFDTSEKFIKIHELEQCLRGSLVLVYFDLRHYPIRNKKTNWIVGNTFSATATQVKVLERGAERRASPYKSLMRKGPVSLPQSPSKKKDQENAVLAFHPGLLLSSSLRPKTNLTCRSYGNCSQQKWRQRSKRRNNVNGSSPGRIFKGGRKEESR